MELYTTKKLDATEGLQVTSINSNLPYMHIVAPDVILKKDVSGNIYIADCTTDPNCIANLIKLKKILCKQEFARRGLVEDKDNKTKLMDEMIWVLPATEVQYKTETSGQYVIINNLLLNHPVKLHMSCNSNQFYNIGKPYNIYNMAWIISVVVLSDGDGLDPVIGK